MRILRTIFNLLRAISIFADDLVLLFGTFRMFHNHRNIITELRKMTIVLISSHKQKIKNNKTTSKITGKMEKFARNRFRETRSKN